MIRADSGRLDFRRFVKFGGRLALDALFRKPFLLAAYLYPTYRCNLRCAYCNYPRIEKPELGTGDWLRLIDELAAAGCRRVNIIGGEPLLREDMARIVGHIRGRGMSCSLNSNGLLVERNMGWLRSLNMLVLSLDAPGAANDDVRGKGAWRAVESAVRAAREAGLPVKINASLSAATIGHLEDLIAYVNRNDLVLSVNIMRSGTRDLWYQAERLRAPEASNRAALLRLADLARTNRRIQYAASSYRAAAAWPDFSRDRYEEADFIPGNPLPRFGPRCWAGRRFLTIGPDGMTYPCVLTLEMLPGGNAAREGIQSAWQKLQGHRCLACHSTCMIEMNSLLSFKPAALYNLVARQAGRLP